MSHNYYECHITMEGNPDTLQPLVIAEKWKFSAIDGDPSLGDGIKCYATMHYNSKKDVDKVVESVNNVADNLVRLGVKVVRRKVELVVYDDRSSTIRPSS